MWTLIHPARHSHSGKSILMPAATWRRLMNDFRRHIMQQQRTLDGNFHTGHFAKNCDPNDISLCNGEGQFPSDKEYRAYLDSIPVTKEVRCPPSFRLRIQFSSSSQKATCVYLKVVNRQDRKKFKNMDVTGTINAQCSHVFVIASVDMRHSERYITYLYRVA